MLLSSLLAIICSTRLTALFTHSPILLGASILLLALQIRLALRLITSSWFAFLLFLIYIGGLLVIFSYFAALSPNHPTNVSRPLLVFLSSSLSLLAISWLLNITPNFIVTEPTPTTAILSLFTDKNLPLLFFMGLILFFALILVVKIRIRSSGPLRPFL